MDADNVSKASEERSEQRAVEEQPAVAAGAATSYLGAASEQVARAGEAVQGVKAAIAERAATAKSAVAEYADTAAAAAASAKRVIAEPAVVAGQVKEAVAEAAREPRATAANVGRRALGVAGSVYGAARTKVPVVDRAHTRVVQAKARAEETGKWVAERAREDIRVTRAEELTVNAASKALTVGLRVAGWALGVVNQRERVTKIVCDAEERAGKVLEEHPRVKAAVDALETIGAFRLGERVASGINTSVRASLVPASA